MDERASELFELAARSLTLESIVMALQSVASEQREAIELAFFEGLTAREIAERAGVPVGTVKSRRRTRAAGNGLPMNCEEVNELEAAYALRTLEPDEQRDVEAHLDECDLHAEVSSLRATALTLSAIAPAREPPAGLRERLLERLAEGPRLPAAAPPTQIASPRIVKSRIWAPYALAATFAAIAVILGGVLVLGDDDDGSAALVRHVSEGTIEARLVYVPDDQTATLTVGGLERLGPNQDYQLWVIRDGQPSSVGVFHVSAEGTAGATFQLELIEGDIIAVTIEPAGGSPQPTSDPIFSTSI